ncbi:hypothetical protein DESUT3_40840 [Desulfuromonas versatilis]|uniref:Thioredoxin domain-containing protein n=1 Tax=Desulfuromonas versatilis TaxID=2802975 RepID=A0ABM8I182_9BACT|nr:redoxin domain-containing protein [Desulfuromonas versatilis]BCR07015.1 hypothetical protein DESUT3_40840 [Desulfuromonas versatilis]
MKQLIQAAMMGWLMVTLLPLGALGFQQGDPAPDILVENIDGEPFRLYEQQGDAFLLNLGATWCPGCMGQSIQINKIHDYLAENNIGYIEVFHQDTEEAVREVLANPDHLAVPEAILDDGQVRKSYNVFMIPRILILDRDFQVVYDGGPLRAPELIEYLQLARDEVAAEGVN